MKMLQPIMHILKTKKIILASGSPRRKQILDNIGLQFDVVPSTFEENLDKGNFNHVYEFVMETAKCKVLEVAERLQQQQRAADLYIGADTVVSLDNKIYEKPTDKDNAFEMLSSFSGRNHTVYTGVVILQPKTERVSSIEDCYHINQFHVATEVQMTCMTPELIRAYIDTGEPMDKAGGYGIQTIGGTLVEAIHGDYFNVMGFPVHRFTRELCKLYSNMSDVDR